MNIRHHFLVGCAALGLLAATALPARSAGTIKLSWDHCAGDGVVGGKTFACDTNTGSEYVYGSILFDDGADRAFVGAFQAWMDIEVVDATLPSWWLTDVGECRPLAFSVSEDPSILPSSDACVPWTSEGILSAFSFSEHDDKPNDITISTVAGVPQGSEIVLPAGQELVILRLVIKHSASTGAGSCAGCGTPACLGLGNVRVSFSTASGLPDEDLVGSESSAVSWQDGYVAGYSPVPGHIVGTGYETYHGHLDCTTQPVGTHGRTWGMIKTLYR